MTSPSEASTASNASSSGHNTDRILADGGGGHTDSTLTLIPTTANHVNTEESRPQTNNESSTSFLDDFSTFGRSGRSVPLVNHTPSSSPFLHRRQQQPARVTSAVNEEANNNINRNSPMAFVRAATINKNRFSMPSPSLSRRPVDKTTKAEKRHSADSAFDCQQTNNTERVIPDSNADPTPRINVKDGGATFSLFNKNLSLGGNPSASSDTNNGSPIRRKSAAVFSGMKTFLSGGQTKPKSQDRLAPATSSNNNDVSGLKVEQRRNVYPPHSHPVPSTFAFFSTFSTNPKA